MKIAAEGELNNGRWVLEQDVKSMHCQFSHSNMMMEWNVPSMEGFWSLSSHLEMQKLVYTLVWKKLGLGLEETLVETKHCISEERKTIDIAMNIRGIGQTFRYYI